MRDALDVLDKLVQVTQATRLIIIIITVQASWLHIKHNGGLAHWCGLLLLRFSLLLLTGSHLSWCLCDLILLIIIVTEEVIEVVCLLLLRWCYSCWGRRGD